MKIITHKDIINLHIKPTDCFEWVVEGLSNKNNVLLPPKISMKPYEGVFCNVMPVVLNNNEKTAGIKVVTRYPERVPALNSKLLLFNSETGEDLAFMDSNWITVMRTGAVAAHSILLLAKKDFSTIGILGLGNTTRATIEILKEYLNPNIEYKIKLYKYKNQAEDFIKRFSNIKNFNFEIVDTPETLVFDSDVIISGATYLPYDFCDDKYYKEGVLVVPIHTLGFTNCDLFFDKVFADDKGHVCHFKYFNKFKNFSEIKDVLSNNAKGREHDRERILAYNIGIALHDVNFATKIYKRINKCNVQNIVFYEPESKFWV